MLYPAYLNSHQNGDLEKTIVKTSALLASCTLCPRNCKVNRLKYQKGICQTGAKARVYNFMPHRGEEPPISGSRGSGAIFFSGCNMQCVYCQNYEFSQLKKGREVGEKRLAQFMLDLQAAGCHNINLVTPTHVLPQILLALKIAIAGGLKIPLVYNTGGYEQAKIIGLLKGIVDVYLADMRYAQEETAGKFSSAGDYPQYNRAAIKEMHSQVGIAQMNEEGIIKRGLIIRHLVLPHNISGTDEIMRFIAQEISIDTYISLMSQYHPCYKAGEYKELSRRITDQEYSQAQDAMHKYGLYNGWTQEAGGLPRFAGTNIKPNL